MLKVLSLTALLTLSACSTVPVVVPVPQHLTVPCTAQELPQGTITTGDIVRYAHDLKYALRGCDDRMAAIRALSGE